MPQMKKSTLIAQGHFLGTEQDETTFSCNPEIHCAEAEYKTPEEMMGRYVRNLALEETSREYYCE